LLNRGKPSGHCMHFPQSVALWVLFLRVRSDPFRRKSTHALRYRYFAFRAFTFAGAVCRNSPIANLHHILCFRGVRERNARLIWLANAETDRYRYRIRAPFGLRCK
jgi:hypothetical protein